MARLPRLFLPEYPVHLVVRGNDRQDIFRSEGDRVFFHRCLVETTRKHAASVHAYVFMSNHVHLLASANTADALSKVIQSMGRRYVSYFNYLYGRTGTLWEGRFHACLVQTDRYFLSCHRYIEMNPVRAGIVARPSDHRWSSNRFNRWGKPDDLLTPHSTFLELGTSDEARGSAYEKIFELPVPWEDESIREALRTNGVYGDKQFCDRVGKLTGRRMEPLPRGRPPKSKRSRELA